MLQPGRNSDPDHYRYGFQGQEKDNEVRTNGNSINYKYRMHDPRTGRFFAVDPLSPKYPFYSPYAFSGNRVVDATELEGLEPDVQNGKLVGYNVQDGQGVTQIAQDINDPCTQESYCYTVPTEITWTSIMEANLSYFPNNSFFRDKYDKWDIGHWQLDMHEGDYLDMSFINLYSEENFAYLKSKDPDVNKDDYLSMIIGSGLALLGGVNEVTQMITFNEETWFSFKKWKSYSQKAPGNRYTGGKIKHAKYWQTRMKWGGRALGAYNAFSIWNQYSNDEMGVGWFVIEQGSNAYGTFGGIYGAAWSIGWESGRWVTKTEPYKDWKKNYALPLRKEYLGY